MYHLFWHPDSNCFLPDEILDIILSYGDIYVTQNFQKVVTEIKKTRKRFDTARKNDCSIWFESEETYFHIYCLRRNYQIRKRNYPYVNFSKYLSFLIIDDHLIFMRTAFWYDGYSFPYEPIVNSESDM